MSLAGNLPKANFPHVPNERREEGSPPRNFRMLRGRSFVATLLRIISGASAPEINYACRANIVPFFF